MRVIQTEAVDALRRHRLLRRHHRRAGADHGVGARPAARRVPRRPDARPRAALAPRARADARTSYVIAPASANTIAKLARGHRGQPAHRRRARLPAPARRRPGDERRDVRASRHAGQPRDAPRARRHRARAGHRARSARRGSGGSGGCPSRRRCSPPSRPALAPGDLDGLRAARDRRRHPRADRRRPLHRQPLVGPDGLRARASAPRAAAPRSPSWPRTSRSRARRASTTSTSATAAELKAACEDAFPACDVLLMAAAVADYRPAERRDDKIKKDAAGAAPVLQLERTDDVLAGLAAARRPEQVLIGFAAETGAGALDYGRGKLARKQLDAVVVNDVAVPGIGFDAADNEVTILTASGRTARAAGREGRRRGRHPRRGLEPAFIQREYLREQHGADRAPSRVRRRRRGAGRGRLRQAHRGEHPAGRQGPRRRAGPRHRRPARRGAHPRRGLPRRRQDRAGPRALAQRRQPVRARAVHGRPAARRHRRHQRLQPARGPLRVPARADLRQRRARRRDQPRLAQDAVRPARVHAGAPRHRRRALARARHAVPRLRDAEPRRVRGHLPAARGAGRPLHGPALDGLPGRRAGGEHARRPRGRRPRARARARRRPRRGARRPGRRPPRARLARPARLRRRAAAPHARRPARRARRLAARPA